MIRLFTDTSANLPAALIQKHDISVVPFSYTVDGEEKFPASSDDFDGSAFYTAMREGTEVKTSMVNTATFEDAFRPALEAGDDVLYVGMSGGISGTAYAAAVAVSALKEDFPDRKIAAVDTLAASLGEGMQVLSAAQMIADGMAFDDIFSALSEMRHRMCQYFTVGDLRYLQKTGRVSKLLSVVGTVLKIKPLLQGDEEGKIILCGKARGQQNALAALADHYAQLVADKHAVVGIAHADNTAGADTLIEMLREKGFDGEALTVCYEPVTGAHVGPDTVALFFMGIHK